MKLFRAASLALLSVGAFTLCARLFLIWNFDRNGGVTCIWLRLRPSLEWREFSSASAAASHAVPLTCGDENGVLGEDLVRWNARFGWWLFPSAALLAALSAAALNASARRSHRAGS